MSQLPAGQAPGAVLECLPSKHAYAQQSPVHSPAARADSSEPRTPDNEPPVSLSRQGVNSPTSVQHCATSIAAAGAAGAAKAAGKRPYERWTDAEEDAFFVALKANAGCLPNVVCTAAATGITTKDYIQVRAYYGRMIKRLDAALTCEAQISVHEDLGILHRAMLIFWSHWVSKAQSGGHGTSASRSMRHKPRKTRDFHAAVQQGVSRLLQQASKVRPTAAAQAAAAAAEEKRLSPGQRAEQRPQPPAAPALQKQMTPSATAAHTCTTEQARGGDAAASAVLCTSSGGGTAAADLTPSPAFAAVDSPVAPGSQPLPRRVTVQMLPFDAAAKAAVEAVGANPYLELANLKLSKSLQFLMEHLQTKWNAPLPPQLSVAAVRTTSRPAALSAAQPSMLVGQLFTQAGQPATFQLNYRWQAGHPAEQVGTASAACLQPPTAQQPTNARSAAKRKLDIEQLQSVKKAALPAACSAAPPPAARPTAGAAQQPPSSAPHLPSCTDAAEQGGGRDASAAGGATAAPAAQPAAPSGQPDDDGLFGMSWPPPSLLVTPSLLGPPASSGPVQPTSCTHARTPAGAGPESAAPTASPVHATFQSLLAGAGAATSAAAAAPAPAAHAAAPSQHSNWGGSVAGLFTGPCMNEFGMEDSCNAFAAGWGHGTRPHRSTGIAPVPQSAAGTQVSPLPLRYFADLADSRLPSASGAAPSAHQRPERLGSLHDALTVQRNQGGAGNADMAGILERLLGSEEQSNLALPSSLLGTGVLPLGCSGAAIASASRLGAGVPAASQPAVAAAGAAVAGGRAGCRAPAGVSRLAAAADAPVTAEQRASEVSLTGGGLLGGEALSQLAMDVGSLLGLGGALGDNSWDAPACSGGSQSSSGLKPFHELFPSKQVAV